MPHAFEVSIRSKEGFRGEVTPQGVSVTVPFSVPKEFGGSGGEWTPEHFLATSVGTCIMTTFLSIAGMSKLSISGYESTATCSMDKGPEGLRITSVMVAARILVSAEKDIERAQRLMEKAEKLCPISNSVKCGVTLRSTVELAP